MNCGVVQWIDGPWPTPMQKAILKLWDMYHEDNHGRMMDKIVHDKEVAKLHKEIKKLKNQLDKSGDQYQNLVDDVSKMYDHDATKLDKKDISMQIDKGMDKLNIEFKHLKNISISQSTIIRNTRKERDRIKEEMEEIKEERDVIMQHRDCLKEEKKKPESGIADLLTAGQCTKTSS